MKGKWILMGSIVAVVVLALAAGLTLAQGPGQEGAGVQPEGNVSVQAAVANRIPIQGRLTDASGNPLNGDYSITARIYNQETGGTPLCEKTDTVHVANGLFDMTIDDCDPQADVNGQQLYLEFHIEGETLSPRQPIYPVPYAWTLRPGAVISSTLIFLGPPLLEVQSGDTSGALAELVVTGIVPPQAHSVGVRGTGDWGVYGYSENANGYGGYFENRATSGPAIKAAGTGIIQSTAVSRIFVPGTEAVLHADSRNDLELEYYGRGTVVVKKITAGAGTEQVVIPIAIPAVLYGQAVRIADMRVHYRVSNSASYIDNTYLYRQKLDGGYYTLIGDTTDRNSTTFTYYHMNCTANECRLGTEEGILSVALHLYFADPSHSFTIGGIRLTLEHD